MDWIPEPSISDDTWGKRGESPFSWLSRSTLPRAGAARSFLNRNLSHLPEDAQPVLYKALRSRWQSAFFELIVARTLQLLGASLVVEPESRIGPRVDFVARFPDITVNVEATSPVINGHAGELLKARSQLLDIIEAEVPNGWGVGVIQLPAIGPNDSKRIFHAVIKKWLSDPMHGFADELVREFPQGSLRLTVRPHHELGYGGKYSLHFGI